MTAPPLEDCAAPDSRLRVCLLVDTLGLDAGTERQVAETAKRLDPTRIDVHVCCLEPSSQLEALRSVCSTALFPSTKFNSPAGIRQARRLREYLDKHRIQIVHAYMNKTALFAVVTSLFSDRIVVTSRLNIGYWYTPALTVRFRVLNLGTTRIMANSEEAKRIAIAAEHMPAGMVEVIYQGVDMNEFRPGRGDPRVADTLGIPPRSRVAGVVANLRPVKDLPLFLHAAKLVAARFPDVSFLIAGSGELYSELVELAATLGIRDRVFFTKGEGRVIDYLARMSIGCLTSLSEGFSNAIMEYMAMGLPVVATAVGGNSEAIVDGETGFLVRARTSEAFAAPLIQLLENEDLMRKMGQRGLERCTEHFEIGKTIRSLEDFYFSLVASGR
jgi:glycosyltransferase involved in cell wall biosynthesis